MDNSTSVSRGFSRISVTIILVVLCFAVTACVDGKFDGEIISEDDRFILDYNVFDGSEYATLDLANGDVLRVDIENTEGSVDVIVGVDGQPPIYEGSALTTFSFTLNITSARTYRITVRGSDARGRASFEIVAREEQ